MERPWPLDKVLFVNCGQSGGDLRDDFERQLYLKLAGAFDEIFERFPLYKLHRVEELLPVLPRCNTEATFECRSLAAARASRKKRSRADSSPRYFSLMTFNVTGHRKSTSSAL